MPTPRFQFGKSQMLTGKKMQKYPKLGKFIYSIFGYSNIGNYARSKVLINLLKKLPLHRFRNILDLGCGYGEFSFMMADQLNHSKITALDVDPERIQKVQFAKSQMGLRNVEVYEGKIETYPRQKHFDFIFSVDVFEHIYENEMPFKPCFEKLKEGGYLLVKIPNITQKTILPQSWFGEHNKWLEDEHIGQVLDLKGLKKKFTDAGFEIVHASHSDGILSRAAWEIGYFSLKMGNLVQLAFLPLCKGLIALDKFFERKSEGNAIQVIGRKPYEWKSDSAN